MLAVKFLNMFKYRRRLISQSLACFQLAHLAKSETKHRLRKQSEKETAKWAVILVYS